MAGICLEKAIVTGINLIFGLFRYKTRSSWMYNKIAEKQGSFCICIVWGITCKLMRWWFIGSVGCVVSRSDPSCNFAFD